MSYQQINLRNKTKLPKVIVNLLRGAAHGFVSDVDPQLRCTPQNVNETLRVKTLKEKLLRIINHI